MPAAWVRKQSHLDLRSWQIRSDSPILPHGEQKKSKSENPKQALEWYYRSCTERAGFVGQSNTARPNEAPQRSLT